MNTYWITYTDKDQHKSYLCKADSIIPALELWAAKTYLPFDAITAVIRAD